jgi:hypothetical protein
LTDRRNCISEYSTIKKCIPNNYLNFFRNENEDIDNEAKSRNKMKLLNNLKLTDIKGNIINLEFFNCITDVQPFEISQNIWPVKIFIIKIIPFILTFW